MFVYVYVHVFVVVVTFVELQNDAEHPWAKIQMACLLNFSWKAFGQNQIHQKGGKEVFVMHVWCMLKKYSLANSSFKKGAVENCVLMVYCELKNNTLKLLLKEHIFSLGLTISFVSH